MPKVGNSLIIADRHAPFTHPDYLDFCVETSRKFRCTDVVDIGDGVDQHAISYHDHDPDGDAAGEELAKARAALAPWFKAFPKGRSCIGNHDALIYRKAFSAGLPRAFLKSFAEIYGAPSGWEFGFEFDFGTWRAFHGTGTSGAQAAFKAALSARQSTVSGHVHTAAGVHFHASSRDLLWGMNVGCGIDRKAYAFAYGRDFKDKPILGCGVVLEGGTLPLFIPMPL
jgi:hypothetical protein